MDTRKKIYDEAGQVIGYDAPPPAEEANPQEIIASGLEAKVKEAEAEMVTAAERMSLIAREARTLRDKTSQWDIKARLLAEAKVENLRAKYEEEKSKLVNHRRNATLYGPSHVSGVIDRFVANLSRHFADEEPGHLNRF